MCVLIQVKVLILSWNLKPGCKWWINFIHRWIHLVSTIVLHTAHWIFFLWTICCSPSLSLSLSPRSTAVVPQSSPPSSALVLRPPPPSPTTWPTTTTSFTTDAERKTLDLVSDTRIHGNDVVALPEADDGEVTACEFDIVVLDGFRRRGGGTSGAVAVSSGHGGRQRRSGQNRCSGGGYLNATVM